MATKKKSRPAVKPTVKKRTLNTGSPKPVQGEPFTNQDQKRRLGTFEGAGEHARVGGRKGIVGQTTKRFKTDKRKSS